MIYVAVGLVLGLAVAAYWWIRRRRRTRMVSFVGLLREPVAFDPAVLARVAGECWQADLGDGDSEGADGFVVGIGMMNTIVHGDHMYLVHCFSQPYTDDVEQVANGIVDKRIRSLFLEHQAWFSCDAMGFDGRTPQADVVAAYRRLAALFSELLDERCLLIYLPDTGRAYAINEDTETALEADDPVTALQETLTVPVIEVADDDPRMLAAVEKARHGWPTFAAAFEERAGENFAVKAPITRGDNTEYIWIEVTALEGEQVFGKLANEPANLGALKMGSKVCVPVSELNDWGYMDPRGNFVGGFTIQAVQQAGRRRAT